MTVTDFFYKPHEPPPRLFAKGDIVELIDSQGFNCGLLKIKYAGNHLVTVEDGRQYRQGDGRWWSDGCGWPFPWIRLADQAARSD